MIILKNLNKYFYKNKKNEIHVINNTSLELNDTGLVALLGPSGCGKTTLLNVIGGLDNVNSGSIYINDKRLTKIRSSKKDEIRNLNIGYIFQDYHLINDMSVYDNVALVLKMIGIKDKEEIKRRVNYVLEEVGIYKYRKRLAGMLSGGERQRVGIARAIVKNPNIIIADEPTGNLDSKNTIEIMNIIKSISKEKLVILVTHEKDLAYFYATRIIELLDGKVISDINNEHNNGLDYKIENKIYLKDFKNHEIVKSPNINLDYYNDLKEKINIKVIVKNGNIYINTDSKSKIEVIDDESAIEIIDDTYKQITKETYEDYKFNYNEILNEKYKLKYSSIYNPITLLLDGFKKIKKYGVVKKILLVGFFISAMFTLYSISNIIGILNIKDEKFVTHNKNYLSIETHNLDIEKYLNYESLNTINYILPTNSDVTFYVDYSFYYQTNNVKDNLTGSLSSIEMINEKDIIFGKMPENEYEVVVDKMSIEKMFKNKTAFQVSITKVEDLIGLKAEINNMKPFTIVGIVNLESPSIYVFESQMINILSNTINTSNDIYYGITYSNDIYSDEKKYIDYNLVDMTIKEGRLPENDYEVIVNINDKYEYLLNKKSNLKIGNNKLKTVGYYTSTSTTAYLVNENTIKYQMILNTTNITIYPKDKDETIKYFKDNNIDIKDIYIKDKEEYIKEHKQSIISQVIVSSVILLISLLEIYLIIRSSFLSRIKEIGTLRAIGVKKKDIYKMFLGEILAILLTASLSGIILMSYILNVITTLPLIKDNFVFNLPIIILSIAVIFIFNILIGLLPVFNVLRKTPAQILSRIDVD